MEDGTGEKSPPSSRTEAEDQNVGNEQVFDFLAGDVQVYRLITSILYYSTVNSLVG